MARRLVEQYYRACGLEDSVFQLIENMPPYLCSNLSELGKNEEFWRRELDNPKSRIHYLKLLDGAIKYAIKRAEGLSKKTGERFCEYLRDSIERNCIGNWLTGYIIGMFNN